MTQSPQAPAAPRKNNAAPRKNNAASRKHKPGAKRGKGEIGPQERKRLRTIAHALSPVVTLADKGLNENVGKEIERALSEHELIKIRISAGDRNARTSLSEEISAMTGAAIVQRIGNVLVLYRPAAQPDPRLSNLVRHQHTGRG